MEERELKALQIAAKSKLTRKGNVWTVPSQTGHGEYQVNVDPDFFNCRRALPHNPIIEMIYEANECFASKVISVLSSEA